MATTWAKGSQITGDDRDRLAAQTKEQYDSGVPVRDIAKGIGRSYGFVHRLLTESGVEFRDRGGNTEAHKKARQRQQSRR